MTDLISRQAALAELDKAVWGKDWDKALAAEMLKSLPSAQQWIPISERKPELYEPVAICSENGRFHVGAYIDFAKWVIDGVQMYVDDLGDFAWFPFPEPWKGESDEEG